jgi:hypothetical protein
VGECSSVRLDLRTNLAVAWNRNMIPLSFNLKLIEKIQRGRMEEQKEHNRNKKNERKIVEKQQKRK